MLLLLGSTPKDFYKGRILIPVFLEDWTSGYWKPETLFLADLGIVDIQDLCELLTILIIIEEAPGRSTRSIAEELGLNRRHVWDVIHDEKHHPHHYTKVYSLQPQDLGARVSYCNWLIGRTEENPGFPSRVMWMDETNFTRDGMFNQHNEHFYSLENPHVTYRRNDQRPCVS
jgi:hypothetical protein